jgi:hypothetical protein
MPWTVRTIARGHRVVGLGVGLEVVLREGESPLQGTEIARQIMKSLGIGESQLVQEAYVDLQK